MSRPRKEIPLEELKKLMQFKPRLKDVANWFETSEDTIEKRIKEFTACEEFPEGLTFAEFRDQNLVHTRFDLIRTALSMAKSGDKTMLIFCLKNLCDWHDNVQHSGDPEKPLTLNYSLDNPDEKITGNE